MMMNKKTLIIGGIAVGAIAAGGLIGFGVKKHLDKKSMCKETFSCDCDDENFEEDFEEDFLEEETPETNGKTKEEK